MCRNAGNDLTSTLEFLYTDFLIPIFFLPIYSGVFFFSFSSQAETQDPGIPSELFFPLHHYGMRRRLYRAKSAALFCPVDSPISNSSYRGIFCLDLIVFANKLEGLVFANMLKCPTHVAFELQGPFFY